MSQSQDITELEWLLDNAGSDKEICEKAIEITNRILRAIKRYKRNKDQTLFAEIAKDCNDLERVLTDIKRRKHEHVLDEYFAYGRSMKKNLDLFDNFP